MKTMGPCRLWNASCDCHHNPSIRKSLALKILVSAADKASSAGFWAHFNIVTYYYYYPTRNSLSPGNDILYEIGDRHVAGDYLATDARCYSVMSYYTLEEYIRQCIYLMSLLYTQFMHLCIAL